MSGVIVAQKDAGARPQTGRRPDAYFFTIVRMFLFSTYANAQYGIGTLTGKQRCCVVSRCIPFSVRLCSRIVSCGCIAGVTATAIMTEFGRVEGCGNVLGYA